MGLSYERVLPVIPLLLLLPAIIIGFNCIWRVEKRLDTFLKLLTGGLIFGAVRKLIVVVGYRQLDQSWANYVQYLDIAASGMVLLALIEMYRIIRTLSREKRS